MTDLRQALGHVARALIDRGTALAKALGHVGVERVVFAADERNS